MKVARFNLFLLALLTTSVLAIAPSSASAIGPGDVLPKPTVTGVPAATNRVTTTVGLSVTVPSSWFVDFGCGFDTPIVTSCLELGYPYCLPNGGQQTCTFSTVRPLTPGTHTFRFAAAYCDDPTIGDCESNGFYMSDVEVLTFVVDRIPPVVTISGGPDTSGSQVLKPGGGLFTFTANEAVTFLCRFDDGDDNPCVSPLTVPKYLKNGSHTLSVNAIDVAGNGAITTRSFRVDVFHPKKCKKGSSKRAKAKFKKCKAKNTSAKKKWKKKHGLK